jgi:hypothetical protein
MFRSNGFVFHLQKILGAFVPFHIHVRKPSNFIVRKIYFSVIYFTVNSHRKNFSSLNFSFLEHEKIYGMSDSQ